MFHGKQKLTNFRGQVWIKPPRTIFYPISIVSQIFIEDPGNLKLFKNLKTNNDSTGSHLVSCRVITSSAIVKGEKKRFSEKTYSWKSKM